MERITIQQIRENQIFQALDPHGKEFLRARRLPSSMNPFGINVTALIAFGELSHIKVVSAVQMMLEDFKAGRYDGKHTIVVPSSGNTAHAVARLAPAFGFRSVKVVMSADVPAGKKEVFSALSFPEVIIASGGSNAVDRAREEARKPGHHLLDQYSHNGNSRAHLFYTGPEVMRALDGRSVGVIAVPMGSGGTVHGVGQYLKQKNREVVVLGVRPVLGEQVPGTRDEKKMEEVVTLKWKDVVDPHHIIEVSRKESFLCTRQLWGAIEPRVGPSSGLAFAGLMRFLRSLDLIDRKRLDRAAFICPDSAALYSAVMIAELDTHQGL